MSTNTDSFFESSIRQLTDYNYPEWYVDIRAHLWKQDLWKFTQSPPPEELTAAQRMKWEERAMDAADNMTLTISPSVKQELAEADFNNGYLMLTKITAQLRPQGEAEFMRLMKEYYTIDYRRFSTMSEFLTHIKFLEERIRATKVTLDDDKQTLICLALSLPEHLQYFVKIWSLTPDITADKARTMLLEEERRKRTVWTQESPYGYRTVMDSMERCSTCGKPHREKDCWQKHPEKAPEWLKLKWQTQAQDRIKKVEKNMDKDVHTDKKAMPTANIPFAF